jgi:hypothetical protein
MAGHFEDQMDQGQARQIIKTKSFGSWKSFKLQLPSLILDAVYGMNTVSNAQNGASSLPGA